MTAGVVVKSGAWKRNRQSVRLDLKLTAGSSDGVTRRLGSVQGRSIRRHSRFTTNRRAAQSPLTHVFGRRPAAGRPHHRWSATRLRRWRWIKHKLHIVRIAPGRSLEMDRQRTAGKDDITLESWLAEPNHPSQRLLKLCPSHTLKFVRHRFKPSKV